MYIAHDEFANLDVAVAVLDTVDSGNGCMYPGAELAVSEVVNISGLVLVNLPDNLA